MKQMAMSVGQVRWSNTLVQIQIAHQLLEGLLKNVVQTSNAPRAEILHYIP